MNKLLNAILEAHGGLDRWNGYREAEATIVTGGTLWAMKGLTQDADPRRMRVRLHEQWASVAPFGGPDMLTDFTAGRIAILKTDGSIVAERQDPRASFDGHEEETPWDPLHRAYFNGYALWTYLATPFLLAMEGVGIEEIEPWREGGETWRVLRATFPDRIATHSRVQDFFFGYDLMLRRHDYHVDVSGGFAAAQLIHAYGEADGIKLPVERRAYKRRPDGHPALERLMVSIDLSDARFE